MHKFVLHHRGESIWQSPLQQANRGDAGRRGHVCPQPARNFAWLVLCSTTRNAQHSTVRTAHSAPASLKALTRPAASWPVMASTTSSVSVGFTAAFVCAWEGASKLGSAGLGSVKEGSNWVGGWAQVRPACRMHVGVPAELQQCCAVPNRKVVKWKRQLTSRSSSISQPPNKQDIQLGRMGVEHAP